MPDDVTGPALVDLWLAARRVTASIEGLAERRLQDEFGVGLSLYALLATLESADCRVNQQEVADLLGVAKSSASRQVEAAVKAGYLTVRPSETSRRENVMTLTPAGSELVLRADQALDALSLPAGAGRSALVEATGAMTAVLPSLEGAVSS